MSLTVTEGTQGNRATRFAHGFTAAVRGTPQLVQDAAREGVGQALDALEARAIASQESPFDGNGFGLARLRREDEGCVRLEGVTDADFEQAALLDFGRRTDAFPTIATIAGDRRAEVVALFDAAMIAAIEAEGFRVLAYSNYPDRQVAITCPPLEQLDQQARAAAESTRFTTSEEGTVIG